MRSLFLQIFFAFCFAMVGISAIMCFFAPQNDPGTPDQLRPALHLTVTKLAQTTIEAYQQHGCSGISWLSPQISVVDSLGHPLCSAPLENDVTALLSEVRRRNRTLFLQQHNSLVQVSSYTIGDGARYFIVERVPGSYRRPLLPYWSKVAIPVSFLVAVLLTYAFIRPVHALSVAFHRFSAGDMDVRLPVTSSRWKILGESDIHTLKRDFNDMADRIKQLVEAQKSLVRDISHELRSPLSRLQVALEIAREELPFSMGAWEQACNEADRLNVLIGEILTLSRMESAQQFPTPRSFYLGDTFAMLLPDMKFEAESRSVGVECTSSCDELVITGQPEMLYRAIENVTRNAIRYAPAGSCVELSAHKSDRYPHTDNVDQLKQECVEICIADRGPGVPEESLSKIFRPFYRVDMAREDATGGSGVGLTIAERAVRLHKGTIRAENRQGGGLIVTICVPLDQKPT